MPGHTDASGNAHRHANILLNETWAVSGCDHCRARDGYVRNRTAVLEFKYDLEPLDAIDRKWSDMNREPACNESDFGFFTRDIALGPFSQCGVQYENGVAIAQSAGVAADADAGAGQQQQLAPEPCPTPAPGGFLGGYLPTGVHASLADFGGDAGGFLAVYKELRERVFAPCRCRHGADAVETCSATAKCRPPACSTLASEDP